LLVDVVSILDVLPPLDKPLCTLTSMAIYRPVSASAFLFMPLFTAPVDYVYLAAPALGLAIQVIAPALASVRIDTMLTELGCICGRV
jgi:hypothetical protein